PAAARQWSGATTHPCAKPSRRTTPLSSRLTRESALSQEEPDSRGRSAGATCSAVHRPLQTLGSRAPPPLGQPGSAGADPPTPPLRLAAGLAGCGRDSCEIPDDPPPPQDTGAELDTLATAR